ncbi:MAG: DUF4097 family beta strand repeat protein [Planctomycetes bacterium]|nr:DUF4097 family beta strand repeat protein [Planctomycetota bacterium]
MRMKYGSLLLIMTGLLLGGCQNPLIIETSLTLEVAGPVTIDVESFNGDVFVRADESLTRATVRFIREARHGAGRYDEAAQSLGDITCRASIVPGDLGETLQVRTATTHPEPHFQRAHVFIDVPSVDGLRIITSRGSVRARNISGEVSIETSGGNVRVMTAQPMTRPVTIINDGGDIDYRIRGESRGTFDCESIEGRVIHRVQFGTMIIHTGTDHNTLKATLNGGENLIRLRTVRGDIRIAVVADPEAVGLLIFEP